MLWIKLHPHADLDMLGYIPVFVSDGDPRSVREQFEANYQSGWHPMGGFELLAGDALQYPGDPPMPPLFRAELRDEEIIVYPHAWVMIRQADGAFEIARMD